MYDVDAIEAINFEQLATVTDRLLLRGNRLPKRRPSTNRISVYAQPGAYDRTVFVRRAAAKKPIDPTIVLGSAILTTLVFIAGFLGAL
jgi:hypothetical protein